MRIIYDDKRVEQALEQLKLRDYFDTEHLEFRMYEYEKGEFLSAPHIAQKDLLFLVQGTVQIYGIHKDARLIPVNLAKEGTIVGDLEFCMKVNSPMFSEAVEKVVCLALSVEIYGEMLNRDVKFLHYLIRSLSKKVYLYTDMDFPAISLEERVLAHMKRLERNQTLRGINEASLQFQCSRRQLQRVLKKLCDEGIMVKVKKGEYKLCDPE